MCAPAHVHAAAAASSALPQVHPLILSSLSLLSYRVNIKNGKLDKVTRQGMPVVWRFRHNFAPQRYKVTQTLPLNPFPGVAAAAAATAATAATAVQASSAKTSPPVSSSSSSSAAVIKASDPPQPFENDVCVLPHPEEVIKRVVPSAPVPLPIPASSGRAAANCSVPSCTKKSRYLLSSQSAPPRATTITTCRVSGKCNEHQIAAKQDIGDVEPRCVVEGSRNVAQNVGAEKVTDVDGSST
jgi:hypothetical protein